MKKKYFSYLTSVLLLFIILMIVFSGNQKTKILTTNFNQTKSIEAVHIVQKYNDIQESIKFKEPTLFASFQEAMQYVAERPVAFIGTLTAYGPDCVGCGGNSACPPRQNFKNGNIYFDDQVYGKIRVVAADRSLPCGSIVRISGINIYNEPVIAVVLDRGGAIKGNHLDLLFETEKNLQGFGTSHQIKFEILRYGW